ncbi:hypothetical protein HYH03_008293 [Edaphochlamys debaryana]|uniref:Uncharacterized protein n=1 Tax=Edaphochlamys debaryana TaxID=47281 RepID=A0A835Y1F7_9CHLO|nr:hypothetical protein HYH03_008293 [Edaphochlamys debaryana]|eukprot:KAG2493477.1 hypothetical protein HYH03_008293 [Edaphochlamys debaryana]
MMLLRSPNAVSLRRGSAFAPFTAAQPSRRVARAAMDPKQMAQMQEMMKNPSVMKKMQEMMQNPEVQKQMQEMQMAMQNEQLKQRMQQLKDDPEFAEIFAEIQKGGMPALMKYYQDPKFLSKLGEKLGDVVPKGPGAAAAAAAAPPPGAAPEDMPAPEINNIRDAAKYGDEEAVEDFIAIGKNINEGDQQGRTALHYSVAYDHHIIAKMLIDEGADLTVRDSMNNTPLHYAAGYGRPGMVRMLLDAGSDKAAQNNTGKTALDLAKLDERNPVNQDEELLQRLAL